MCEINILTILLAIFAFGFLIFIHEGGHFLFLHVDVARIAKSAEILNNAEQLVHYYRQEITRFLELETVTNMDMRRILDYISVNKDGSVRVVLKKFEEMAVA